MLHCPILMRNAVFDAFLLEFTTSVVLSLCVGDITKVMNSNGLCAFRTTLYTAQKVRQTLTLVTPHFEVPIHRNLGADRLCDDYIISAKKHLFLWQTYHLSLSLLIRTF